MAIYAIYGLLQLCPVWAFLVVQIHTYGMVLHSFAEMSPKILNMIYVPKAKDVQQ